MKWKVTAVVLTVAAALVAAVAPNGRDLTPDPAAVACTSHEPPCGLMPGHAQGKRVFSLRDGFAVGVAVCKLAPPAGRLVPIERTVDLATPQLASLHGAIRGPPRA